MASNTAQLDGYDLKFLSTPPDALVCPICTFVAKDPQQMNCCGRVYCRLCLSEHKKSSTKCPCCRQTGNSFKDKRSDLEIRALKVRCVNFNNGCEWVKELSYLKEHLQSCDYTLLPCTNECKKNGEVTKLNRKELVYHLASSCPRRQYSCPYCHQMGEYIERTGAHLDVCIYVTVKCTNVGCQDEFPRLEVSQHASVCNYEPVKCKFFESGCMERPLRKDRVKHEKDYQGHLQIATKSLLTQKEEIERLKDEVVRLKNQSYKTQDTITLTKFGKKKTRNSIFYGQPFYTSKNGYKFCLRIDCNGYKNGKGSHVSVYTCLMKGIYDNHLVWPFTGRFTIELLNQLEDKNHHKDIVTISTADNKYTRRVVDVEKVDGYGCQFFIPHHKLGHQPDKNVQYLMDDSLIFRVSMQELGNKH